MWHVTAELPTIAQDGEGHGAITFTDRRTFGQKRRQAAQDENREGPRTAGEEQGKTYPYFIYTQYAAYYI